MWLIWIINIFPKIQKDGSNYGLFSRWEAKLERNPCPTWGERETVWICSEESFETQWCGTQGEYVCLMALFLLTGDGRWACIEKSWLASNLRTIWSHYREKKYLKEEGSRESDGSKNGKSESCRQKWPETPWWCCRCSTSSFWYDNAQNCFEVHACVAKAEKSTAARMEAEVIAANAASYVVANYLMVKEIKRSLIINVDTTQFVLGDSSDEVIEIWVIDENDDEHSTETQKFQAAPDGAEVWHNISLHTTCWWVLEEDAAIQCLYSKTRAWVDQNIAFLGCLVWGSQRVKTTRLLSFSVRLKVVMSNSRSGYWGLTSSISSKSSREIKIWI